jgi:peroxin-7
VKTNKTLSPTANFHRDEMEFRTVGYNGYAIKYSPFVNDRLAVATSANFGLVGNGRLYILGLTANGIVPLRQ